MSQQGTCQILFQMSNNSRIEYKQLLKVARNDSNESNKPRKKRRTTRPATNTFENQNTIELASNPESSSNPTEIINLTSSSNSDESDEFEDVSLIPNLTQAIGQHSIEQDSDESEEFEDVDLNNDAFNIGLSTNATISNRDEVLTIPIQPNLEVTQKKKRTIVSIEERTRRLQIHRSYILFMATHGAIRNSWCNNKSLASALAEIYLDDSIRKLIKGGDSEKDSNSVRSRKLLDGLHKLMNRYNSKFRITSQGLIRKNWNELSKRQNRTETVSAGQFRKLIINFRGNRDIAVQGFVSLLRGLGLNARLVFSLQPPDFTDLSVNSGPDIAEATECKSLPNSISNSRDEFLSQSKKQKQANGMTFTESRFPVFWTEVWDKHLRKWVSIDPIVMKSIEVCPKRRKSQFEPPSSDNRNQITYVLAFDKAGRVRDVTRRYSLSYNANTVRKRIESRSEEDAHWYRKVLKACSKRNSRCSTDIFELKEFHDRDLAEGMPNNLQAFKNHPLYALESQIRQNEVIYPKDNTTKCGTFRSRTATKVIPVYKRSSVHHVRSAKAWYLRGRVLKIGAQPLKIKEAADPSDNIRLYAEFQTKLYIPKPVENGIVPKNEFGNVDVYTATMLPDNGALIRIGPNCPMKLLQTAARILGIDYAKAIVAFDFGAKSKRRRTNATAREGGIVIAEEYKEAMDITVEHLIEDELDQKRQFMEISALNNWKYFLTKLRVQARVNREHGVISDAESPVAESDNESSDDDQGGFILTDVEDNQPISYLQNEEDSDDSSEFEGGGFLTSDKDEVQKVAKKMGEKIVCNNAQQEARSLPGIGEPNDTPPDVSGIHEKDSSKQNNIHELLSEQPETSSQELQETFIPSDNYDSSLDFEYSD
ncbi:uncharacterized protein J8A68_005243 [[Candida] subhashii]|uniref:DNA repair protein RAD4 n=1 Tax=[Candida] subhashii TaxID=561895 RepID=A0A8J5UIB6_9ASCO|nr:uncharacterized protein J8A68_005243 [[Candida] subhashii]KAG7661247.1 hypothetical protein J8A68_005243 [[Candida] subhashii]